MVTKLEGEGAALSFRTSPLFAMFPAASLSTGELLHLLRPTATYCTIHLLIAVIVDYRTYCAYCR